MKRWINTAFAIFLAAGPVTSIQAGDDTARAALDKAIKALGGEERLAKVSAFTWKSKGNVIIDGSDSSFKGQGTVQGFDQCRFEFEGNFNGQPLDRITVLKGDKGWLKEGDQLKKLDEKQVANQKRSIYLTVIPITLVPLKGKEFAIEAAIEEKVGGKQAVGIKGTGPDGKDFTIYFDKESGLPIKWVAKMTGPRGEEFTIETSLASYKKFDGIQKATRIESKRDGEKFLDAEVTDFKIVDKVDPATFDQPK